MTDLTEEEQGVLAGLVRVAIRKTDRSRVALRRKYGERYDPAAIDARVVLLEGVYRKLGGAPERITNRLAEEPDLTGRVVS